MFRSLSFLLKNWQKYAVGYSWKNQHMSKDTGRFQMKHCKMPPKVLLSKIRWTASSEFGTYRLCEQRRFRRACASAQSRQNLRCSLIQAVSQEEPSDRKPDPWPLWMAGHPQLKFVMTECSKTQIRLTRPRWVSNVCCFISLGNKRRWHINIAPVKKWHGA